MRSEPATWNVTSCRSSSLFPSPARWRSFPSAGAAPGCSGRSPAPRRRSPSPRRCRSGSDSRCAASSGSSPSGSTLMPSIGASYAVGIDGLSLLLILLTTSLSFIAVMASWATVTERVKEYYIAVLLLEAGMLGVYMALDLLLFCLCWVVAAASMCVLIGAAGGRMRAGVRIGLIAIVPGLVILAGMLALVRRGPLAHRHADLRPPGVPTARAAAGRAALGVSRVLRGIWRRVGWRVPLVADGRGERASGGRADPARRGLSEDGHLRVPPVEPSPAARRVARLRAVPSSRSRPLASSTARWRRFGRPTGRASSRTRA